MEKRCYNCWYDEFCDWSPSGHRMFCENWKPEDEIDGEEEKKEWESYSQQY